MPRQRPSRPLASARALAVGFAGVVVVVTAVGLWQRAQEGRMKSVRAGSEGAVPAAALVAAASYVGQAECASCHADEAARWRGSDHALAMQSVDETSVLGDFADARFTYDGVTTVFYRRDGRFMVRTDGPDGRLHDYEVAYTFGVRPLQQYLIAFPKGRLQPLGIAWDSRPAGKGGQRWFHLYPEQHVKPADPRHWTHRNQNWNSTCAACHATNLQKGYDRRDDSFSTSWSEPGVSCEACHGAGSRHVAWARAARAGRPDPDPAKGLVTSLRGGGRGGWIAGDPAPRRIGEGRGSGELETCAPCHSRGRPLTGGPQPGGRLLDTHAPALLDARLYHADGQILDEVFEYGSFVQSRMHGAGVTCSDCHDPHSGQLTRGRGNATCVSCHLAATFDTASHHHHRPGTEAASCVSCHMPGKNYMVVDGRRDHSFRVPRPDVAAAVGAPNACAQCHGAESPAWAADAIARWYGPDRRREAHYAAALDAGRRGAATAEAALSALAVDRAAPSIVRATALSLLTDYLTPASLPALRSGLTDDDPLVRAAAVRGLSPVGSAERVSLAAPLLRDPYRAVRTEAARVLAGAAPVPASTAYSVDLDRATAELIAAELAQAERPEAHLNVSAVYLQANRPREAEEALLTALRLDPRFVPAMVNLADLYRGEGRDAEAESLLTRAVDVDPDSAEAAHGLGLLRVRQGRRAEASLLLRRASELAPEVPAYGFAYGLALRGEGELAGAVAALERTRQRHPANADVLAALADVQRELGNLPAAIGHAEALLALQPGNPDAAAMLAALRSTNAAPH